jgi:tetratricopeptide (TPR) repeat protein
MIQKLVRLGIVLLLIGTPAYLLAFNRDVVPIYFTADHQYSLSVGVIVLGSFVAGALFAAAIASAFGVVSRWREYQLKKRETIREAFLLTLTKARSAVAAGDWLKAKSLWTEVLKKDPTLIIARVELAHVLDQLGEPREGLKVLEAARAHDPKNLEVLFRAGELMDKAENASAVLDNMRLILDQQFSVRAANMAARACEQLGRFEDALEYFQQLERANSAPIDASVRVRFEILKRQKFPSEDDRRSAVLDFVRKNQPYAPALEYAAALVKQGGGHASLAEAAQILLKGAKALSSLSLFRETVELWLEYGEEQRALAAARSAQASVPKEDEIQARLLPIYVHARSGNAQEVFRLFQEFYDSLKATNYVLSPIEILEKLSLQGMALAAAGRLHESAKLWQEMLSEIKMPGSTDPHYNYLDGHTEQRLLGSEATTTLTA